MAEAKVIEVGGEGAGFASAEDEAVFAERAGGVRAKSDDAMLPNAGVIEWAGAIHLLVAMLVDADSFLEEERGWFVVVTAHRGVEGITLWSVV